MALATEEAVEGAASRPALHRDGFAWGIALVALGVYANTLGNGFTLDDTSAVVSNEAVRGPFSLRAIATHDYWGALRGEPGGGLYRPLPTLTYALDWHLGGGRPWVFHLTNGMFHALACLLFYRVLAVGITNRRAAVLAGVLFAVHPLHTEAVASIVGRADVMAFVFSVLVWAVHPRSSRAAGIGASLLLFAGLLCKESVVLMGPLLLLRDFADRRTPWQPWRPWLTRYGMYGLAVGAYAAIRVHLTGTLQGYQINPGVNALAAAGFLTREVSAMRLFARGVELLIAPTDLMPIYGASVVHASARFDGHVLLGAATVVALLVLAVRTFRTEPRLSGFVAWLLLPGLFVANAFIPYSAAFGERLWYLPSAGALLLAGEAIAWLARRGGPRVDSWVGPWVSLAAGLLPVLLFIPMTVLRNAEWRNDETLFTAAVETTPGCSGCHYVLGILRLEQGSYPEVVTECGAAARLTPDWGSARGCYATGLAGTGRIAEADAAYRAMETLPRTRVEWKLRYVGFLADHGRPAEAAALVQRLRATPMNRAQRAALEARARAAGTRP